MRLIDRQDTPLAVALIVGTATMFAQPLRSFLSIAEEISGRYQIDLIPGLMIFGVVFTVHFWKKFRAASAEVVRTTNDAEQARKGKEEMERLVSASNAIASALDMNALRVNVHTHLPAVLGPVPMWLAVTNGDSWSWLMEPAEGGESLLEAAPGLLRRIDGGSGVHQEWKVFPLGPAGDAVGLLGVHVTAPPSAVGRVFINAVAGVLRVAVRNVQLVEQLESTSAVDPLTGCLNRAYGFDTLSKELRRARRTQLPLTILMIDLDNFKLVNDEHGHVAGDRLLAAVGDALHKALRSSDIKCRYGGDEFLIVLPETSIDSAQHVVSNIRRALGDIQLQVETGVLRCNASIGMAAAADGEVDAIALVQRADTAMYTDKARVRAFARPAPVALARRTTAGS